MDEQGYKFGVGVLVVASLVIAVILVLFFGAAPNFLASRYQVTIRFDAAPGVATDTPVRKNGVQIGRVKGVKLLTSTDLNDNQGGVDLTLELDSEHQILAGEMPRIGNGSIITGDAVVEFIPPTLDSLIERFDGTGGSPANGMLEPNEELLAKTPLKNGDFLRGGKVAPDPLETLVNMQQSFGSTLSAIEQAGNQVTALAVDVRRMIGGGDGDIQRLSAKAEMTIDNFNQTLDAIEGLFEDPKLRATINTVSDRLPKLVDEAEGVMRQTKNTLASFEGVGKAAEETMQNVSEFTKPLGEQGEKLVSEALGTLNNLDALLGDLRQVSARFNNSQGTVAKLLEDDELYYSVISTLQNIENATQNIRVVTQRLQPIIDDARVFSDKVARDPGSLIDLRGAITGRPRGAGLK